MPEKHCWKGYREHLEEIGKIYSDEWVATYYGTNKTCMAAHGHEGEHEFVDDDSIVVAVKSAPRCRLCGNEIEEGETICTRCV